jgi:threonine/homoserine/homoserine lactone efflux protein
MLGTHDLPLFAATVFVLNATPGVDMMLVLTSTLRRGVRAGLLTSLGVAAGCLVHTLLAAFGIAALLAASAAAFSVLKLAGAAYLVWLAIGMFREAGAGASDATEPSAGTRSDASAESGPATRWAAFRRGVLTNALNPKVALFFLALLPQFIDADAPHKTLAFLFLGGWVIAQGFAFLAGFVLLVAPLRRWSPSSRLRSVLNVAGGGLFVLLAARLAWPERH